jgi:hypothetical protein
VFGERDVRRPPSQTWEKALPRSEQFSAVRHAEKITDVFIRLESAYLQKRRTAGTPAANVSGTTP